ncbi:HWE histidine kinase domain-containing protein [Calycomorphotria hydatis]|uniref:histidine kinase n=1 Tax=Calycomorphotria hydatis TaxID=2528027 RepID=A0A517T455_9PLAN|nr:HWE histidine kinase domain-containing protein [Calycomorphotria hydatis]QDT63155.1 Bacteriophytochrome [Calycomorphotria hydatis]
MTTEDVALSNCDREPVHIPGKIQTFGGLLGFDLQTMEVHYCSENLQEIIPSCSPDCLGKKIDQLDLSRDLVHGVRGLLGLPTITRQRERLGVLQIGGKQVEIGVFLTDGIAVLECELVEPPSARSQTPIARVRSMLAQLDTSQDLQLLLNSAVNTLRHLTGFDRVMAYRFLPSGAGEVAAEARSPAVNPFLGLRYPASDIPKPARELMVKSPFRVISDIRDPHAKTLSNRDKPLDLGLSQLRGVSPIHVEYLENMGVRSTMNTSIIVHGQLWGLFAFHHYRRFQLSPDHRSLVELLGHFVSLEVQQQLEKQKISDRKRHQSLLSAVREHRYESILGLFHQYANELMSALDADGVTILTEEEITHFGETPADSIARQLQSHSQEELFHFNRLNENLELTGDELSNTAGAIVLKINPQKNISVIFYRNEVIQSVRWAGMPEKNIKFGPNGPRLHPRGSFEEYRESVSGECAQWTESNYAFAGELRWLLIQMDDSSPDEVAEELMRRMQHRDLLIAELNHRVRNILALVQSIARQTKSSATSVEEYLAAYESRIAALASAHDQVGASGLQWANIRKLIETELNPHLSSNKQHISISGDPIAVRAEVAPTVALVIHELCTNAVKHGALSPTGESLDIHWTYDSGGLMLAWRERMKEQITTPGKTGFGLSLIERAIPFECNGECTMRFEPDGLIVDLWLPHDAVRTIEEPRSSRNVSSTETATKPGFSRGRVIIVEDNTVLALELESQLQALGFESIQAFGSVAAGMEAVKTTEFDLALLDINLEGEVSFDIAFELLKTNTPIVFVTGYDSHDEVPEELAQLPFIIKPVSQSTLEAHIKTLEANGR